MIFLKYYITKRSDKKYHLKQTLFFIYSPDNKKHPVMKLHVQNEYGRLEKVLMASSEGFYLHPPINQTQKNYYGHNPPVPGKLVEQQMRFAGVLEEQGVEIIWAEKQDDCPNQINTRDIAFVAGDTLVLCRMKEEVRKDEVKGIESLLNKVETPVIKAGTGIIEGGDVVIDNGVIFAGISSRSDYEGIGWLEKNFSEKFRIVPVELTTGFLHLDVVFNIVDRNTAIIYEEGVKNKKALSLDYELIKADRKEQENLAVNTITVEPGLIISESRNHRVAEKLRSTGSKVILLDYSEVTKIGGSFRCSTCPLVRH